MTSDLAIAHWLLGLTVFAYVGGALGALGVRGAAGRALTAVGAVAGSLATLALGLWSLGAGVTPTLTLPVLPFSGLALRVDGLSAFFLVVVGVAGVAVGAYGFGYSAHYEGRYSLRLLGATLNLLLLSLAIQVTADNALTFLMTWEMMSVAAYVLVLTEHDQGGTVRAANWYLGVTHAGFAALVAAFLLLSAGDPTTSFEAMRAASLSPGVRDAVFALALLGFSAKAGIVPLHVWLPMAHPVAPSHVSALMSGVVIKMGVYGLLRVTLDLLGGGPAWWGGVVLGAGAISALLGVLYALMEHDLKRLLAYHSVENVGIIFIGIGAGLMSQSYGLPALALVGFVAALYHTLNHACFKGLLFLGAGSVLQATHTRNMEKLGGLIKRMPRTALFFLVGSAAISALPPLNGFASEWLVFQALLGGAAIPRPEVALVMPIAVAMLALTSGLAVACFVKAFGITFLALPRSTEAENAREAPGSRANEDSARVRRSSRSGLELPWWFRPWVGPSPVSAACPPCPSASASRCRFMSQGPWARCPRSWWRPDSCFLAGSPGSRSGCWPTAVSAWGRRGGAGGSARRRAWSTPRPRSPNRFGGCSRRCTGRPRISRSTSTRRRSTSFSPSNIGARSIRGSSGSCTLRCSGSCGRLRAGCVACKPARCICTSPTSRLRS